MKKPNNKPLDPAIRTAMAAAVEEHSLRALARAVGMSASGLNKFIAGSEPYRPTRRRLELWYRTWGTSEKNAVRHAAIAVIVKTVGEDHRDLVVRRINEILWEADGDARAVATTWPNSR